MEDEQVMYFIDERNNLSCVPNNEKNIKKMACDLKLNKNWYKSKFYEVPEDYVDNILNKCNKVSSKTLFRSIYKIV